MLLKTQKKLLLLFLLSIGVYSGCKKDSPTAATGVPNVSVNGIPPIDIDQGGYTSLLTVGGWVYVTGGYTNNGIILFCNGPDSYLAFDRSCPYDCTTNPKAFISIQAGGITAKCHVCGTIYSLYSGTIISNGPGTIALKQYYANFDNPPYIVLSNNP